MKQATVKKYTDILVAARESGKKDFKEYCKEAGLDYFSIKQTISRLKQQNVHESEDVQNLLILYNEIMGHAPTAGIKAENIDTDDAAETSCTRDEDGKIQYYNYKIFKRNKLPLVGKLSREEMSLIHRLYSYYGDSLTQRVVSRHFVNLSLVDFKRILRAFNITKASAPFAPHDIEEKSEEELREIQLREKENSFLRKAEEDQIKNNEKLLKKYAQENIDLREQLSNRTNTVNYLLSKKVEVQNPINIKPALDKSNVIIFLSDLHIGAYNNKVGYVKLENYDKAEIIRRLDKVIQSCAFYKDYSITVCNLGDSVDSYNKQTTRGGHDLPTVISNKEQSVLYLEIMMDFFNKLFGITKEISYICVGESNHDGDWGWINNVVLAEKLDKEFGIKSYISNNPIDKFDINDTSIVFLHGKDNVNQYKGFPLTLDFKTESWFNSYFIDSKLSFKSKTCIVKGDLHQYAYTCAKHFDYISAPSVYGSSDWITANFGKTPWGVLVMEIDPLNNIKTTIIKE